MTSLRWTRSLVSGGPPLPRQSLRPAVPSSRSMLVTLLTRLNSVKILAKQRQAQGEFDA